MPYLHGGLTSIRQLKVLPLATVSFGQEITLPGKQKLMSCSISTKTSHNIKNLNYVQSVPRNISGYICKIKACF